MAALHERMPVVLEGLHWPASPGEEDADALALTVPVDDGVLRLWPVIRAVNAVRDNGPDPLNRSTIRTHPG